MKKRKSSERDQIEQQAKLTLHVFVFLITVLLSMSVLALTNDLNQYYGPYYSWLTSGTLFIFISVIFHHGISQHQPRIPGVRSSIYWYIVKVIEHTTPQKTAEEMKRDRFKVVVILSLLVLSAIIGAYIDATAWSMAIIASLAASRFAEYQFSDGVLSKSGVLMFFSIIATSLFMSYAALRMEDLSLAFEDSQTAKFAAMYVVGMATGYIGQIFVSWFEHTFNSISLKQAD